MQELWILGVRLFWEWVCRGKILVVNLFLKVSFVGGLTRLYGAQKVFF